MQQNNPFKAGDKVRFKDGDKRIFTIYSIYSPTKVSLNIFDYEDTESDLQTDINDIEKIKQ